MKLFNLALLTAVLALSFSSCKKICYPKPEPPKECPTTQWKGAYATFYEPVVYVGDSTFIKDGVAKLTETPYNPVFYTSLTLPVPNSILVGGDSVTLAARVKNPSNVNGAVFPFDVNLLLEGEENTGIITFIGEVINQEFNKLKVGSVGIQGDPTLLYRFDDWSTVELKAANNTLAVYRDGALVNSINYSGVKIGSLKNIAVSFKGSGTVDWVKLSSSASGATIMLEDFDVDYKSNAVWNCDAVTLK